MREGPKQFCEPLMSGAEPRCLSGFSLRAFRLLGRGVF